MNSKLTERGYILKKNDLEYKDIQKIKRDLVVSPFVPKDFPPSPSYPIYLESPKKLYIPRYYGIENFGEPKNIELNDGNTIDLKFEGKLRDIQIEAKNKYMESINNNYGGGIICLQCGQGKTVLALNILSEIKLKTLIVVHKEFLANQWIDRIKLYLPNSRIGKIQGKVIDILNKDICVAMLQTLSLKEFDKNLFDSFGLVIIDEVHHMSSEVFSRALLKVNLKYTLGLTATPERADRLTHVFLKFLGPIVYKYILDTSNSFKLVVKHIKYISNDNKYNCIEKTKSDNICVPRMINNITEYNNRNLLIVNVLHYLAQNPERNIILLSDRREHLKTLYELLDKNLNVGFYIGGIKQQVLDKTANECQIILSTYSMASEALDIPKLNCLLLSSPKVSIEQSVGRILRKKHSENSLPIVIDFEDHFSIFKNQYKKRLTYYKSNNYIIDNININDETDFNNINHMFDYNNVKKIDIKTYIKKKCNITKN